MSLIVSHSFAPLGSGLFMFLCIERAGDFWHNFGQSFVILCRPFVPGKAVMMQARAAAAAHSVVDS